MIHEIKRKTVDNEGDKQKLKVESHFFKYLDVSFDIPAEIKLGYNIF